MVQNYDLDGALRALENGQLILYPTDTVWSIGCDANNLRAIMRIRKLKQTPTEQGMELLVSSLDMLKEYITHLHPRLETLLLYHVRPLTIIHERGRNLPQSVLHEDGSIAIRLVQDDYCQALINQLGAPIIAASADLRPGYYPTAFGTISSDVIEQVDYVSRHRRTDMIRSEPSVMVRLGEKDELDFLRD